MPHTVEEAYEVADAAALGIVGEAPRRARRPPLPGLLPRPAARRAGRTVTSRRSRAACTRSWSDGIRTYSVTPRPALPRACASGGRRSSPSRRGARASSTTSRALCRRCCRRARCSGVRLPSGTTGPISQDRSRRSARSSSSSRRRSRCSGCRHRRPSPSEASFGEVGDLLFTLVNVSRRLNVDPELALRATTARFVERVERARAARRRRRPDLDRARAREQDAYYDACQGRARIRVRRDARESTSYNAAG